MDLGLLRAILPDGGTHKGTSTCKSVSCERSTREGKPYCSKHVGQSPYIQAVVAELVRRVVEISLLERRKAIPDDAHLIRETLFVLRMKTFTVKGLARRLDISHIAADALINQISKRGLGHKTASQRGEKRISGLVPPDLLIDEK